MQKQLDVERIAKTVLDAVAAPLDALAKRMDALEARPAPLNGKDGIGIADHVTDQSGFLVLTLTDGRSLKTGVKSGDNGKDADPEMIAKSVKAEVAAQLPEAVSKIKTVKGDPGPVPDMNAIRGMVDEAVAALPKPENGKDGVDGVDGQDADEEAVAERVKAMVLPEIEKAVSEIEPIKGDKGDPGEKGDPGTDGKDGAPGADGKDGLGFEDLEEELADDGRIIVRHYKKGSEVKSFRHRVPAVIYRGVWKEMEAEPGDAVTWGGSLWICTAHTNKKPEEDSKGWQLAAKRGREGKGVDEDAVVERIMARVVKEIEKHTKGDK